MELPIFLLNDLTGGVSAYHDREMLDAAIIPAEEVPQISAWGSDGERLNLSVSDGAWQIAPCDPPVYDIELLRDLLQERVTCWSGIKASPLRRDRVIERAGLRFAVQEPPSGWRVFFESFLGILPFLGRP